MQVSQWGLLTLSSCASPADVIAMDQQSYENVGGIDGNRPQVSKNGAVAGRGGGHPVPGKRPSEGLAAAPALGPEPHARVGTCRHRPAAGLTL